MDLSRYVDLFLAEGREHVAALHASLASLASGERAPAEVVATAFRAVHSIKGMGGAMGYTRVASIAHSLETDLDAWRSGGATPTRATIDRLVDEADALARAIERAPAGDDADESAPASAPIVAAPHVRVAATRLDTLLELASETDVARTELGRELEEYLRSMPATPATEPLRDAFVRLSHSLRDLRDEVLAVRMVPAADVFDRIPQLVRETARTLGKEVDFAIVGADVELDRSVLDRISDPLLHLLRNAMDHGLESAVDRARSGKPVAGRVELRLERDAGDVVISVHDDGRGVDRVAVAARAASLGISLRGSDDASMLAALVHPGFTTASGVTSISGRGVGLDAVDAVARELGGRLDLESRDGDGATFTLRLPLSIAFVRGLVAYAGNQRFVVPFAQVAETIELEPRAEAMRAGVPSTVTTPDGEMDVVTLRAALRMASRVVERAPAIVIRCAGRRRAVVVDAFAGFTDVVVRPTELPPDVPGILAGAAILPDGAPAFVLDLNRLAA